MYQTLFFLSVALSELDNLSDSVPGVARTFHDPFNPGLLPVAPLGLCKALKFDLLSDYLWQAYRKQ